jgi:3-hydroxyisobutyrate dehydrogenase-like beta-hydroxyacid dehydrogenase
VPAAPQAGTTGDRRDAVGIVGLGRMGTPIAGHLIEAGFPVAGYDVDPSRTAALAAAGGEPCDSAASVARRAGTVLTSLPSAGALHATLDGPGGLLPVDERPLVIVETSTLALGDKEAARRTAEAAGATLLDCPLSGTAGQAQDKDLVVYASGEADAVARCRPIFEAFARACHRLGPFGAGSKMKFIANLLVAVHNVAAAEAFVLATKAGIDRRTLYDVITSSAATSRMFEVRGPMMVAGDYDRPGVSARVFHKDLRIIDDFARAAECPTPLFTATLPLYTAALAAGLDELDAGAVHTVLEQLAGLEPRVER